MTVAVPLGLLALAWTLLALNVEPVPTWFYVCAWYPTLWLMDDAAARIARRPPLRRDVPLVLSLFLWSPVVWLVFEAVNFRIANWYYVFLPPAAPERWAGIVISFATVVPAVVLAERFLDACGVGRGWRTAGRPIRSWELKAALVAGTAAAGLVLFSPERFFHLTWGVAWLLTEPFVYRRLPEHSLFRDVEAGRWDRIGRLVLGGLGIGLLWEFYNGWARGRWIYTVPWLENLKLFEMPPLGFLGFPFFALEAWAMYHALCALGLAVEVRGSADRRIGETTGGPNERTADRGPGGSAARAAIVGAAVVFSVATLLGMERWTISSVVPRLEDLPGIGADDAARLRGAGIPSPFVLARANPEDVARRGGFAPSHARDIVHAAELATLRGIGARHATRLRDVGVRDVCALSRADPLLVWRRYHGETEPPSRVGPVARPTRAEVAVWVRAARWRCGRLSVSARAPHGAPRRGK